MPANRRRRSDLETALEALEGVLPGAAIGVVLGSGLGGFAARLAPRASVPYSEVAGIPRCRVPGHAGVLHAGRIGTCDVIAFEGRPHLYEGATVAEVTFAVRLLAVLRARAVVLTTSAGAVNADYQEGDLVLVRDQLNLTGLDPARAGFGRGGELFPVMAAIYHPVLLDRVTSLAFGLGVRYSRGVLAGVRGPSYETPAEVRALRTLGADLVCMSTVLEAMAAAAAGLPVVGLGVVANRAGEVGVSHERVLERGRTSGEVMARFVATAVEELDWTVVS